MYHNDTKHTASTKGKKSRETMTVDRSKLPQSLALQTTGKVAQCQKSDTQS